jgi:hypothetical protein
MNSSEFASKFKRMPSARRSIIAPEHPIIPNHAVIAVSRHIRSGITVAFIKSPMANWVWQLRKNQGCQQEGRACQELCVPFHFLYLL